MSVQNSSQQKSNKLQILSTTSESTYKQKTCEQKTCEQKTNINNNLIPAKFTLHRFGIEVTQMGIGDGLGWDCSSPFSKQNDTTALMILYPGDILELAQPEICVVPRKVEDFMEDRKEFFQGKLLVCIANDHHLSVLYGIEKRTIQLARYYGDVLLSEPEGKILDECRWTVLGAVENIIRPYPNKQNDFTNTNISGKDWQISLVIPSYIIEAAKHVYDDSIDDSIDDSSILEKQYAIVEILSRHIESQFQNIAEMNSINELTSFVSKYIPDIQIKITSIRTKDIYQKLSNDVSSHIAPPLQVSHSIVDHISGIRIAPIYLQEGPTYTKTPMSCYQKNRERKRQELARTLNFQSISVETSTVPKPFLFDETRVLQEVESYIKEISIPKQEVSKKFSATYQQDILMLFDTQKISK